LNIHLTVAYDGTGYAGWQRQDNALAVQQVLEEKIAYLLKRPIELKAAGRTDAGVHALNQHVAFTVEDMPIPIEKLPQIINGYLPADIAVQTAELADDSFNPRFAAKYKIYEYKIHNAKTPLPNIRRYSAFVPNDLKLDKMAEAAAFFVGRHDFKAFCATGSVVKDTVRHIFLCRVFLMADNLICIQIKGNGFLYNMVRIIAGTLLYVGLDKIEPADIAGIISSKDRTRAGKTMPPEGLTLVEVGY